MYDKNLMTGPTVLDGNKLWAEILKAIVSTMPSQLFPLFKEVYGRDYPKGTTIVLLSSETSSFQEDSQSPPGSTLMDIALLVAGTDYYHLECQMKNNAIPDYLKCRVVFPNNSEHIYKIPTVKIQTYSLEEIHKKTSHAVHPLYDPASAPQAKSRGQASAVGKRVDRARGERYIDIKRRIIR